MSKIHDRIFYREEHVWFKEAYTHSLSDSEAKLILEKLKRHFCKRCRTDRSVSPNVKSLQVRFHGNAQRGMAYFRSIRLGHNPSLGLLIHEFCHVLDRFRNHRNSEHDWKLKDLMLEVYDYCKSKGLWKQELKRRLAPKPEKPKPTGDEIRAKKIEQKQAAIKRCNRKIKLLTTLKKKHERSLRGLLRHDRELPLAAKEPAEKLDMEGLLGNG